MGNMVKALVSVRGTRSLLWHRFGEDAIPLEKQERTGVAGNDPEEWRRSVLVTGKGQLYLEPTYIFGCIRDGSKNIKKGKGSILKDVASTLQVMDDMIPFDLWMPGSKSNAPYNVKVAPPPPRDPDAPVYLDVRGVVNKSTGGRNVRYRVAASTGWNINFSIIWDKTIVSRDQMHSALIDAGRLVGLADARNIGFGRFEVLNFDTVDA